MSRARAGSSWLAVALLTVLILVLEALAYLRVEEVTSPRAGFSDFPRREIHLYASEADWRARRPALTVYYLGVPDTPEFSSEAALNAYLGGTQPRRR